MNVWNGLPFFRILISLLSGIVLAIQIPSIISISWYALIVGSILFIFFQKKFGEDYNLRYLKGIPMLLYFVVAGIQLVNFNNEITKSSHFGKHPAEFFVLKICETPTQKANSVKIVGEVVQIKRENYWESSSGRLLTYVEKDDSSTQIDYGDLILCKSTITEISAPKNPHEFNYKKYLSFHQIFHQCYLNKGSWYKLPNKDSNPILATSYHIRKYLLTLLKEAPLEGQELAIASALILGYEDDLSHEIIGSFAATGALHVLSVSGLHVGIVFLVLGFILNYIGESKKALFIRFLLSIAGLWLYALITGLSPSVWRAAVMFSLIAAGKFYKKDINTLNIVACSAFILLCINPYFITEVGFQLSYLAVIGIVTLHPQLYRLLYFKHKIIDQIWSISCVSITAQLVTFPLGLLYFHQFPNYFLLSNLIVIPLSTVILYGGLLLMGISKIPVAGGLVAQLIQWLLWLLKSVVVYFEQLPFAIIDGISISTAESILIYVIIVFLYCFWHYANQNYLKVALSLIVVFCSYQIIEKYYQRQQRSIIVYAVNHHQAVDFIEGNNNTLLADSTLLCNSDKLKFHLIPNWNHLGLKNTLRITAHASSAKSKIPLFKNGCYLGFAKKLILNTAMGVSYRNLRYKPDIILLHRIAVKHVKNLIKLFPGSTYICDGSISVYLYQKLKREHPQIQIRSVNQEGAISIKV